MTTPVSDHLDWPLSTVWLEHVASLLCLSPFVCKMGRLQCFLQGAGGGGGAVPGWEAPSGVDHDRQQTLLRIHLSDSEV